MRKTWLISLKNNDTPVHRLSVVLQRNNIYLNRAELQYHIQPIGRCGTVFEESSYVFLFLYKNERPKTDLIEIPVGFIQGT